MNGLASEIEQELPFLLRAARALTRDRDQAEDLVQDCLERALAHRASKQTGTSTRAWLYTILRNLNIDRLRRDKTRGQSVALQENELRGQDALLDRVYVNDVLAAMERLDPEQREIIMLAAVDGFAYAEIAAIFGIPLGTVMSRLSRARDALSGQLGEAGAREKLARVK